MTRSFIRLFAAAAACAALLIIAPSALATTYKVNRTSDHAPNGCSHKPGKDCTLREAILKANVHPGTDKIVLHHGRTYHRSLVGSQEDGAMDGDLDISNAPLVITSDSHRKAIIEGRNLIAYERVFDVFSSAKFVDVKITHGFEPTGSFGAGIAFEAGSTLTLLRTAVTSNSVANGGNNIAGAGVAVFAGKASISRSTISNNRALDYDGAGIGSTNGHSISLSKSTVSGNRADRAGGIYAGGPLKVVASTISGNHAAGISATAGGIGVDNKAVLYNSTIDGNTAERHGGGIFMFPGANNSVSMNGVTLAHNKADSDGDNDGNGGGIYTLGGGNAFSSRNSIIALNAADTNPDCDSGVANSFGQNLLTSNAGCLDFSAAHGDFVNVATGAMHLGNLASNGGPTKTDALFSHSRALNRAGSDAPNRDQRGHLRHNPDIGAYER